ncbi:glycerophosphodiester phosphodiesterase [Paenibacillus physcomitrellae]|nr:glycerophosphodiester phosphodiesterase [Paenibacillus physcomitrellae]
METLDNTLESVRRGIELGADVIEEDVRVTRDGVAVLAHDDLWPAVGGEQIRISQMDFAELRKLEVEVDHAGKKGIISFRTLEEMLEIIKPSGKIANLDLKTDEAINAAAAVVDKLGMLEQVFLSGCEVDRAREAEQRQPKLRKLLNADVKLFTSIPYEQAVSQTCQDALETSCFGINIYHEFITPALLERAQALELPVYAWTVNDTKLMELYADMGVASITARNVEALVGLRMKRRQT